MRLHDYATQMRNTMHVIIQWENQFLCVKLKFHDTETWSTAKLELKHNSQVVLYGTLRFKVYIYLMEYINRKLMQYSTHCFKLKFYDSAENNFKCFLLLVTFFIRI